MTNTNNNPSPPSRNPADDGTLAGMMKIVLSKFLQGVDDMLPARVVAYNRAKNVATVQPLINMTTTGGVQVPRAQVASVPVFQYGGGGFVVSFPIKPGDTGWIKANDRDISIYKQTGSFSQANTQRKHSFSDAMFFPDTMLRGVTIGGADANSLVIQNLSGTVKIAISEAGINITSPAFNINGKNVSDTHVHTGVVPGSGDTGPPL